MSANPIIYNNGEGQKITIQFEPAGGQGDRLAVAPPKEESTREKVIRVIGVCLAVVGLLMTVAAIVLLGVNLSGLLTMDAATPQTLLIGGLAAIFGGLGLSNRAKLSSEMHLGPLSLKLS